MDARAVHEAPRLRGLQDLMAARDKQTFTIEVAWGLRPGKLGTALYLMAVAVLCGAGSARGLDHGRVSAMRGTHQ